MRRPFDFATLRSGRTEVRPFPVRPGPFDRLRTNGKWSGTVRPDQATSLVTECMEGAAELRCGLVVDIHTGDNWADAHA